MKKTCPWCGHKDDYQKNKYFSGDVNSKGKNNVSAQLLCKKCGRHLKQ